MQRCRTSNIQKSDFNSKNKITRKKKLNFNIWKYKNGLIIRLDIKPEIQ